MDLKQITSEIKKIGWDSRNVTEVDEIFVIALSLPVLKHGAFPTAEEKAARITVRKTGAGRFVACYLPAQIKTNPMDSAREAIGRLRSILKNSAAFDLGESKEI